MRLPHYNNAKESTLISKDLVPMSCALTAAQHAALKVLAQRTGNSMGAHIREAVAALLAKAKKEGKV